MKRSPLKPSSKGLTRKASLASSRGLSRSAPAEIRPVAGLRKTSGGLRKTRLQPVSDQRRAENAEDGEWTALKALVDERDGGVCQVAPLWPEIPRCYGRITHHHIEPTGDGYPRICPPHLILTVCWAHHTGPGGLHTETRLARERGVLR